MAVIYLGLLFIGLLTKEMFCSTPTLKTSEKSLMVLVAGTTSFNLSMIEPSSENFTVKFIIEHADLAKVDPSVINVENETEWKIEVYGLSAGLTDVYANAINTNINISVSDAFVLLTVYHSDILYHVSIIVGWIYFVAWSISFYPQVYTNWKRKSVVGLNFDFLCLNLIGFILYSVFNVGLYWIPELENEYKLKFPRGINPVQINDIFFSIHAVIITSVTIVQCFLYERGDQKVSLIAKGIIGIFFAIVVISLIISATSTIPWLEFIYICSYIKLAVTLIKYIPQAVMNYKRKSTSGWSIGNILLDFTGGILSMLQMIFNSYNYDDWQSIFGDPTKFGLGLFSVCFDILFIVQHYILYRHKYSYEHIDEGNILEDPPTEILQPD